MANKINYTGSSKLIQRICQAINDLIDHGGGGGGSTVSITPTLSSGTKIADFEIDGQSDSLYAPSGGGGGSSPLYYDSNGRICIDYDLLEVR